MDRERSRRLSYWDHGGQDIDGSDTMEGYKGLEIVFINLDFDCSNHVSFVSCLEICVCVCMCFCSCYRFCCLGRYVSRYVLAQHATYIKA